MNSIAHLPEMDPTVATIAANIRAEIARRGMKDGEFAAVFKMTPMSMSRRLSGNTPFTTPEVKRAADYFGVSVGSLFEPQLPRLDSNQQPIGSKPGLLTRVDFRARKVVTLKPAAGLHTT